MSAGLRAAFVAAFCFWIYLASAVAQIGPMFPGPGLTTVKPIQAPVSFGSATGGNAVCPTSATFTTSTNIVAGDFLSVFVQYGETVTTTSVSDGTNNYVLTAHSLGGSSNWLSDVWTVTNAAAVSSGATLTVTWSGAGSGCWGYTIAGSKISSALTASPVDVNIITNVTSFTATPTQATGTLAQTNEVIYGYEIGNGVNGGTYTESTGFTNIFNQVAGRLTSGVGYVLRPATTSSITYAPTLGNVPNNTEVVGVLSIK